MSTENTNNNDVNLEIDLNDFLGVTNNPSQDDSLEDVLEDNTINESLIDDGVKIDFPHFKVSKSKFLDALKVSKIFAQDAGKEVISKSVGLEIVGDKLCLYMTNFELYATKEIDIINTENKLNELVIVNLPILVKLLGGLCPSILTIYKKEETFYIKLLGGDMVLETVKLPKEQLLLRDMDKFIKDPSTLSVDFLKTSLKGLFSLASSAITPAQRRIFFSGDKAFSMFSVCVTKHNSTAVLPEMDFNMISIKSVFSLCNNTTSTHLDVLRHKNRVLLKGQDFSYCFLTNFKPTLDALDSMSEILKDKSTEIPVMNLREISNISTSLIYSTTKVEFNYTPTGDVICVLKTKRDDTTFTWKSLSEEKSTPFKDNICVQASLLRSALSTFNSKPTVKMYLCEKGLGFTDGTFHSVLYAENYGVS
jgi:hypothetical protein